MREPEPAYVDHLAGQLQQRPGVLDEDHDIPLLTGQIALDNTTPEAPVTPQRRWTDIEPSDATELDLSKDLTITAPLNENGERCPWPWEPQQLVGAPIGQYHCDYCGAMVIAGIPHLDYANQAVPQ